MDLLEEKSEKKYNSLENDLISITQISKKSGDKNVKRAIERNLNDEFKAVQTSSQEETKNLKLHHKTSESMDYPGSNLEKDLQQENRNQTFHNYSKLNETKKEKPTKEGGNDEIQYKTGTDDHPSNLKNTNTNLRKDEPTLTPLHPETAYEETKPEFSEEDQAKKVQISQILAQIENRHQRHQSAGDYTTLHQTKRDQKPILIEKASKAKEYKIEEEETKVEESMEAELQAINENKRICELKNTAIEGVDLENELNNELKERENARHRSLERSKKKKTYSYSPVKSTLNSKGKCKLKEEIDLYDSFGRVSMSKLGCLDPINISEIPQTEEMKKLLNRTEMSRIRRDNQNHFEESRLCLETMDNPLSPPQDSKNLLHHSLKTQIDSPTKDKGKGEDVLGLNEDRKEKQKESEGKMGNEKNERMEEEGESGEKGEVDSKAPAANTEDITETKGKEEANIPQIQPSSSTLSQPALNSSTPKQHNKSQTTFHQSQIITQLLLQAHNSITPNTLQVFSIFIIYIYIEIYTHCKTYSKNH